MFPFQCFGLQTCICSTIYSSCPGVLAAHGRHHALVFQPTLCWSCGHYHISCFMLHLANNCGAKMNVASSHVLLFGKFCNFVVFCEQCFSLGQWLSEQSLKQLLTWLRLYAKSKELSQLFFNAVTHFVGGKSQLKIVSFSTSRCSMHKAMRKTLLPPGLLCCTWGKVNNVKLVVRAWINCDNTATVSSELKD